MTPGDLHGLQIEDRMAGWMFQQMSAWTDDTEDQMPPGPRQEQYGNSPELGRMPGRLRG